MTDLKAVQTDAALVVDQLVQTGAIQNGLLVVGCSTSEIAGERIGTSGSEAIAAVVFEEMQRLSDLVDTEFAFQCCEHLNRALVVERSVQEEKGLTEVSAIPVPQAGGSMASYAYKQMQDPVLVEMIEARSGIDIGSTLIGMHMKRIAVPLRIKQRSMGQAHVTVATTRPPLIGGVRAVYERSQVDGLCEE